MSWHVAVVGSGAWSRVHLAALASHRLIERITLVARHPAARDALAREFPRICRATDNLPSVLADESIALVDVVLPHHLHAEAAGAALRAGKHVICEKPAGTRLAQFDQLVDQARRSDRRLLVIMDQLYNPVVTRTRQLIDEGRLGRVFLSVENAYSDRRALYRDEQGWRTTLEGAGGGIFIDGAYHMVYRHLYYLAGQGAPSWVQADTAQLNIDPLGHPVAARGEDFIAATIGYADGARIAWSHAWTLSASLRRARQGFLAGSEATLEFPDDPYAPLLLHRQGATEEIDCGAGPRKNVDTVRACIHDYLDCLDAGREPQRATLALARRALEVITTAYDSATEVKRLALAHDQA